YQLYTLLVFDEQEARVPIAWAISSRNKIEDIYGWLAEVQKRGKHLRADWQINAFITDDASAEIQAIRYLCDRQKKCARRMDYLFYTLVYKVEPFYKHKRKLQKSGFLTNFKKERHLLTVVERAKSILDTDCLAITPDCNQLWVRSQTTRSTWYLVRQCGALDVCECAWAIRGNTCKHVLKALDFHKQYVSMSSYQAPEVT
ncbi:hypothetical protein KI387_020922, partial [Taxus chinensis]